MFSATQLAYSATGSFSTIVDAYLEGAADLREFYAHPPTLDGIKAAIGQRKLNPVNRKLLVDVLNEQYNGANATAAVRQNIERLTLPQTFTVCTAHQPNLFTGPLYFLYKILHAVKLAAYLQDQLPAFHFVPVYYMGSEDADFAELNHTYVEGRKLEWKKEQTGAVGRMVVDKTLVQLIDELEGQLTVKPFGQAIIGLLRKAYVPGLTIQAATFALLNEVFGEMGLVVLIPDTPRLKAAAGRIFADDLFQNRPHKIVSETSAALAERYKAQAYPREINLFYLRNNLRERIEKRGELFQVVNSDYSFTEEALQLELQQHPERFSPNVVLRGIFQETVLPNIAFVGGGGELAYWLQLKNLFNYYNVPFPVLVLRNSFLVVEEKWRKKAEAIGVSTKDFFTPADTLLTRLVTEKAEHPLSLNGELTRLAQLYSGIRAQASAVDPTLAKHTAALEARALAGLAALEKKMLRAEKRKHDTLEQQVVKLKEALFPNDNLQERVENFSLFYATWGAKFIQSLYQHSPALEQVFTVLTEVPSASTSGVR